MKQTNLKLVVRTAVATAALVGAQLATAADVAAGSVVKLRTDGFGTLAGVFNGSVVSGPGAGGSFQSFCLEKFETFTPGANLYVKSVGTATQNAVGGTSNATKVSGGPTGSDELSAQTAYLFTQYYNNTSLYAGTDAKANSFQKAVWYLEGEVAYSYLDLQAKTWITAANTAVTSGLWSGLGNVRVLNLYKDAAFTSHSQDQLYMATPVPEPESYAFMLAGLGLMGAIVRRRKVKSA